MTTRLSRPARLPPLLRDRRSGPFLSFAHGLGGNHLSWWQQVPHFRNRYTCCTLRASRLCAVKRAAERPRSGRLRGRPRGAHRSVGARTCVSSRSRWAAGPRSSMRLRSRIAYARWCLPAPPGRSHVPRRCSRTRISCPRGNARPRRPPPPTRRITSSRGRRAARARATGCALPLPGDRCAERRRQGGPAAKAARTMTRPAHSLRSLNVPTLWITGEEDIVYPPFLSDILAKLMPKARVAQVKQAGSLGLFRARGGVQPDRGRVSAARTVSAPRCAASRSA